MKRSRFTEEQIIGILRKQESGPRQPVFAAGTGTRKQCLASFGGMARKLKALEDENATLKTLLAEAMLDNAVLKEEVRVPAVVDDYRRVPGVGGR